MNQASRWMLMIAALTGLSGCVTYADRYIAAGPGGTWVDCRYEPCTRDGYAYWSGGGRADVYAGTSWHGSAPAWYGSSRWHSPYRVGYTPWGFRDPWYDPWYGSSWTWASPWYPAWHPTSRSRWSWSVGYGWSSGPWSGSLWYRPWSHSTWYGPNWYGSGWYGGGWSSTWHRPYRGHRPPPRERTVDWRPADGIGVANPRWLPASEEVQRIADRDARAGGGRAFDAGPGTVYESRRAEPAAYRAGDAIDPARLDRPGGRVMPRGAADGWIAPMPGSRSPGGERWADERVAIERTEPARFDPPPQRVESPEPRYERPMPARFERSEPARFDPPPQRVESPEPRYARPMPERFERPEPARFDPPPQRFERPEPARFDPPPQRFESPEPRYERPMPQRFERPEPARFDPPPQRFERPEPARFDPPPQRFEAPEPARYDPPSGAESRSSGRRFGREDFEPN